MFIRGNHSFFYLYLLSGLTLSCSPTPPPIPASPPPPISSVPLTSTAPPAPEWKEDPPGTQPGLTPFTPLLSTTATSSISLQNEQFAAFKGGVISIGNLKLINRGRLSGCLLSGISSQQCNFIRTATWKHPPTGLEYYGNIPEDAIESWSPLLQKDNDWDFLSSGHNVVYGFRSTTGFSIDTINEKGEIKEIASVPNYNSDLSFLRIIELPSSLILIGIFNSNEVGIVPLQTQRNGNWVPVDRITTGLTILPEGATADWARSSIIGRKKVGYGSWTAAPSLNEKGEPESSFYLAWTEVIPPAKYTPAGVAPKKLSAKHGCGRSSRPLTDISVEKRVHVTRFNAQGKRIQDQVLSHISFQPFDTELALSLVPTDYGYLLNGLPHDRHGKLKKDLPPTPVPDSILSSSPLAAFPSQTLATAAYDEKHGEGIALISEKDRQVVLRFDGTGEPLGEPIPLNTRVAVSSLPQESLVLAGTSWVALHPNASEIQVLTGPLAPKTIPLRSEQSWLLKGGPSWILPLDDEQIEVIRYVSLPPSAQASLGLDEKDSPPFPLLARVNLKTGEATTWKILSSWLDNEQTPRLSILRWVGRDAEGQLLFFGTHKKKAAEGERAEERSELYRFSGEEWSTPTQLGDGADSSMSTVFKVWKDNIVIFNNPTGLASWINKGLSLQFEGKISIQLGQNLGPIIPLGWRVLTGDAEIMKLPDAPPPSVVATCPASFATAPHRLVLVCIDAPDQKIPGLRVGTRTLRF